MQILLLFLSHDHVESALTCWHINVLNTQNHNELLAVIELPLHEKCNVLSGQFWKQSVVEHFDLFIFVCSHALEVFLQKWILFVQTFSSATAADCRSWIQKEEREKLSASLHNRKPYTFFSVWKIYLKFPWFIWKKKIFCINFVVIVRAYWNSH